MNNSLYKTRYTSYPSAIDDVNIEGIWSKTLNGEQFILHNSKHPIFRTLESLSQIIKKYNKHFFLITITKKCHQMV